MAGRSIWDEAFPQYPWVEGVPEDVLICAVRQDDRHAAPSSTTGRGRRIEVTLDSGCGKSVMPENMIAGYKITPSPGSIAGQKFVGPGGEKYANVGQVKVSMQTEAGVERSGRFQVSDAISKPLAAAPESCDCGNLSVFDNDGSAVIRRDSPEGREIRRLVAAAAENIVMHRRNNVKVMPMWIKDPPGAPFTKQRA